MDGVEGLGELRVKVEAETQLWWSRLPLDMRWMSKKIMAIGERAHPPKKT